MSEFTQTIFVVDDDSSFLKSISRWLRANGYLVESHNSAMSFLNQLPSHAEGCVLADLQMPDMSGIDLQDALVKSDTPLPVVFLTGHGDIESSVIAMRGGAEDFLTKTAPQEALLEAIERALSRDTQERKVRLQEQKLLLRFAKLTPRENEVLSHVLRGRLNKQIAADLCIDERSVKRHRTNLMHKLDVTSVVELAQLAFEAGLTNEKQV